jgi:hypothetical protein
VGGGKLIDTLLNFQAGMIISIIMRGKVMESTVHPSVLRVGTGSPHQGEQGEESAGKCEPT